MPEVIFDVAVMAHKASEKGRISLQLTYSYELAYQVWSVLGNNLKQGYSFSHMFDKEQAAIDTYNLEYDKIFSK